MPRMSHREVLSNFASSLGAWKTSVARYHKSSVFARSVTAERPPRLRFCVNPVFWIGVHRFEARDRKLSCARARYRRRTQRGASDRNRAERFRQWVERLGSGETIFRDVRTTRARVFECGMLEVVNGVTALCRASACAASEES